MRSLVDNPVIFPTIAQQRSGGEIMRNVFLFSFPAVFVVISVLPVLSCGSSISTAQNFIPNRAPVVTKFAATYSGTDTSYKTTNLYSGMPFTIDVDAYDPENKNLTYEITSSQGTFSDKTDTETGVEWTFYIGYIGAGQSVTVTLKIFDDKNAQFIQTLDIGSGKTAPGLSVVPPSDSEITPDGLTTLSFSCDSKGSYRVYLDNSITSESQATIGSSVTLYSDENSDVKVKISGPTSKTLGDVVLEKDVVNRIWIVFRDNLSLTSVAECVMYVEGTLPRVLNTTPADGNTNISCTPTLSVQFSKAIDTSTLTSSNITMSSASGDVPLSIGTFDSSLNTISFSPQSALSNNTAYTVTLAKSISDTVSPSGNKLLKDYTFTFTTVSSGMIPNVEFTPASGTYDSAQSVKLSSTESGVTIAYTLDGSDPAAVKQPDGSFIPAAGTNLYSSPLSIAANTAVKAMSYKTGFEASAVSSASYGIRAEQPVFSYPTSDPETNKCTLKMTTPTSGAIIRYTVDDSDPSGGTELLSGQSISIEKTTTVRAVAVKSGLTVSPERSATITVKATPPVFSPVPGTLNEKTSLAISHDSSAVVYYTITSTSDDPGTPSDKNGLVYGWGIDLDSSAGSAVTYYVNAVAYESGKSPSTVVSAKYVVDFGSVGALTYSITPAYYSARQDVVVSCATSDATVTVTASASGMTTATYTGVGSVTVPVTRSMTLTATAAKGSMKPLTSSAEYTLYLPDPVVTAFNLGSGKISYSVYCAGADTVVYSQTPSAGTTASASVSGCYYTLSNVTAGTQVSFYGTKTGWTNSSTKVRKDYVVTYDANGANGGTVPVDSTLYDGISTTAPTLTLPINTGSLVKTDAVFAGWNTDPTATSVITSVPVTGNLTLYAVWTSTQKDITMFMFSKNGNSLSYNYAGIIEDSVISVYVPAGTSLTNLVPTIYTSSGATVNPASGVSQDFSSVRSYTVTAANGSTKTFMVKVYNSGVMKIVFTNPGLNTYTVTGSCTVQVKSWGAGGKGVSGSGGVGGAGGYSFSAFSASANDEIDAVVGTCGGTAQPSSSVPGCGGSGGGGASLVVLKSSGTFILKNCAGGGGSDGGSGGNYYNSRGYSGGSGGGITGTGANGASGGTAGSGGAGGRATGSPMGVSSTSLLGLGGSGASSSSGIGGGGGGFGGGGTNASPGLTNGGSGGGGYSERFGTVTTASDSVAGSTTPLSIYEWNAGRMPAPGNSSGYDCIPGIGAGGSSKGTVSGGNGLVVLYIIY
jgi:uncharacterized repeat protein (TIGR02543 family)